MTREELNQEKQQEIINEQKREKRKKVTLFFFKISFYLIIAFLAFYFYTSFISTGMLVVKEERIISDKLPVSFDGLKVIQFSDLHYGTTVFDSEIKNVVNEINKRKPDLVVFTGDLIDRSYNMTTTDQEKITELLKNIDAKLGKYAVPGEEDGEEFYTIMKQSDFNVLDNSYEFIYNKEDSPILLIGLDSYLNDDAIINEAYSYFNEPTHNSNIFTISLSHEPDIVDKIIESYSADLFLAGHSHNGNIRIPFVGSIYKVDGAKNYDQSYYKINDSQLFISSGIGTNGPGFRLFCRPSINFFRISKI